MIQLLFHEKRIYLGQYHWCCCFQGTEKNLRGHEIFQFSCSRSKIYSPITLKLQCIQLACHHASFCSCMEGCSQYESHCGKLSWIVMVQIMIQNWNNFDCSINIWGGIIFHAFKTNKFVLNCPSLHKVSKVKWIMLL